MRVDLLRTEAAGILEAVTGRGYDRPGDTTPDAGWVETFSIRPPITGAARLLVTVQLIVVTAGDHDQRLSRMASYLDRIVTDLYAANWLAVSADEADDPGGTDTTTYTIQASKHTITRKGNQ